MCVCIGERVRYVVPVLSVVDLTYVRLLLDFPLTPSFVYSSFFMNFVSFIFLILVSISTFFLDIRSEYESRSKII